MQKRESSKKQRIIWVVGIAIIAFQLFLLYHSLKIDRLIKQDLPLFNYQEVLLEDEFDVYIDGTIAYDVNYFPSKTVDFSGNEMAMKSMDNEAITERYFDYTKHADGNTENVFETKRGITMGSTVQALVSAYSGTECLLIKADGARDNLPTERLIKPWYKKKMGDAYTLRFTSCYIRGNYWDRKKTALSTHPWSLYDYDKYPWFKGYKEVYAMSFVIEDDVVKNIIIQEWY